MFEGKHFDKNSGESIYSQIVNFITQKIIENEIKYGTKLPAERDLADLLGVSRGTIKKAYGELERKEIISIVWGSGAYVIKKIDSDKEGLGFITNKLFTTLEEKNFSQYESKSYLALKQHKFFKKGKVHIALISDCPELHRAFISQVSNISGALPEAFLLEDVIGYKNKIQIFSEFDLVLATADNLIKLSQVFPENQINLAKIYAECDKQTTIDFLKITYSGKIGIISKSRRFWGVVNKSLKAYGLNYSEKDSRIDKWTGIDEFNRFIADKTYLIMPPIDTLNLTREVCQGIFDYISNGGVVIIFNYVIDQRSILFIEEEVSRALYSLGEL